MSAKQRRYWWAAGILAALVGGIAITYLWVTETRTGKRWLLTKMVQIIDGGLGGRGHLRVKTLHSIGWRGRVRADSVAIVDTAGVPVITIAHLDGILDLFALVDKRIHLRTLDLTGVQMAFHRDFTGPWNIAFIIAGDTTTKPPGPPGWGDDIVIDEVRLTNGEIVMIAPWAPNPIFTGAARDSVIAVRDSVHDITRTPNGLLERREVTVDLLVGHAGIIMQPSKEPSSLEVDSLRGKVSDPPVQIVSASGKMSWTPDSLRLELPTVALPASTGSVAGRVWWNQPGPVRYDMLLDVQAGLSDLTWIWDVLPSTGGGKAKVRMRTLESADDAEFSLSDLDISTMSSRVAGKIDVITRPAELLLHNVDLTFAPLGIELARQLSYGSIPDSVKGSLEGRLVATTGGPLSRFAIDRLEARFLDARVPGAVSSIRASGLVGIGAEPTARQVVIQALRADMRSARALSPTLPTIDGIVEGRGLVAFADLRTADLRGLALTWTDAVGNVSRVTGNARVGYGLKVPTVNVSLVLDPISMAALARIDTTITVRSTLAGRLVATGSLDSMSWKASVAVDSGSRMAFEGTAAWKRPEWRVAGVGDIQSFDVRRWTGRTDMPTTALSGTVRGSMAGTRDSSGVLFVSAAQGDVSLLQREAEERPGFDLLASVRLDPQRLFVDSATVHVGGITLDARGKLARGAPAVAVTSTMMPVADTSSPRAVATNGAAALVQAAADTIEVSAAADTLETVRRQLSRLAATVAPMDTALAESLRSFANDTLKGDASLSGYLFGSLDDLDATFAGGARELQVGAIRINRLFGSTNARNVLTKPAFEGVIRADSMTGMGPIRISSAVFQVQEANPDSGKLLLDASSIGEAHLIVRGTYQRRDSAMLVIADSLDFVYDSVTWRSAAPIRIASDANGLRIDSLEVRSSEKGVLAMKANVPTEGAVNGTLHVDRFPVGEAVSFALGTRPFSGLLTGDAQMSGTRAAPVFTWKVDGDSLGVDGTYLPRVSSEGRYADKRAVASAVIRDSLGGVLRAEVRVPLDLSIATVEKRLLSDAVDADVTVDSLRLEALGITIAGMSRLRGSLAGKVAVSGTTDRPLGTGTIELSNFSVRADNLGIEPNQGRAVIRAAGDSIILESFRMTSGGARDTIAARGALRYALDEPVMIDAQFSANTAVLARQRNGTDLVLSGSLGVKGELKRPALSGSLFVPSATLAIDPLGASTALDLTSETSRQYLAASELPAVAGASSAMANFGKYATIEGIRVELGNEVWVRTPESTVKLTGSVGLTTKGDALAPEGEITAERGQYRLDLGVVSRTFRIDSGSVRFFGDPAIAPTLDISATNDVRLATGDDVPVVVHIGGTIDRPLLALSSNDPLYASAPESEIISLLIFGAPTFALDGGQQSTVKAVTGVLVPTVGGAMEGALQRLLPGFNTVQVTTGQASDDLTGYSLINNLSITAGKQIGERTFLRLNTGVCRRTGQSSVRGGGLWLGVGAEYRLARGLTAQVGVDPGSAPCSRFEGDVFPRMQFGIDLFKNWVF